MSCTSSDEGRQHRRLLVGIEQPRSNVPQRGDALLQPQQRAAVTAGLARALRASRRLRLHQREQLGRERAEPRERVEQRDALVAEVVRDRAHLRRDQPRDMRHRAAWRGRRTFAVDPRRRIDHP
jgi:hypothetical protein